MYTKVRKPKYWVKYILSEQTHLTKRIWEIQVSVAVRTLVTSKRLWWRKSVKQNLMPFSEIINLERLTSRLHRKHTQQSNPKHFQFVLIFTKFGFIFSRCAVVWYAPTDILSLSKYTFVNPATVVARRSMFQFRFRGKDYLCNRIVRAVQIQ